MIAWRARKGVLGLHQIQVSFDCFFMFMILYLMYFVSYDIDVGLRYECGFGNN